MRHRRTHTHTVATLEVSVAAYEEIGRLLREAQYDHAFMHDGVIDMTGLGLIPRAYVVIPSGMLEGVARDLDVCWAQLADIIIRLRAALLARGLTHDDVTRIATDADGLP